MPDDVCFVDTWLWVALLNKRDSGHKRAQDVLESCRHKRLVTSQMVLTEFLNMFAGFGEYLRNLACEFVDKVSDDPNITVIDQTSGGFDAGLRHYRKHRDKEWGLTDCASMCIMLNMGINSVMTDDNDFEQAGFVVCN